MSFVDWIFESFQGSGWWIWWWLDYDEEFDDDEDDDKPSARKKLFSGSKKSDDEDTSTSFTMSDKPKNSRGKVVPIKQTARGLEVVVIRQSLWKMQVR